MLSLNRHMGYTDGKTEADILIEECDTEEEYTHVQTMKVQYVLATHSSSVVHFIYHHSRAVRP